MKEEFTVSPYEVKGNVNYSKLIKQFGLSPLKGLPKQFDKEILFRRGLVFAHRDFSRILECIKNKKPFVMMTGLMPTGKFHIGHAIIAKQMIFYQSLGAKIYIAVADIEAYQSRGQSISDSRKIAEDYIKNYIALGLKMKNLTLYFQSNHHPAYYKLQNLLSRHASFNEFKAVYGEISPGKMHASTLQAADMLHPQLKEFEGPMPVVIPVGADQDPHLRIARDLSKRIKDPKFIQLSSTYNKFIPGLKGGKMSASDPSSFIAPTDSPSEVKSKINKYAFSGGKQTLEEHRKHGGNPDIDVSFQYLKYLFEPSDQKLAQMERDYRSGKLTTGELKKYTIEKINAFLKDHQIRYKQAEKLLSKYIKE